MKLRHLLLIVGMSGSCADSPASPVVFWEPELIPLVSRFYNDMAYFHVTPEYYHEITQISYRYDLPANVLGFCKWDSRAIQLNAYLKEDPVLLEWTVYHELGHCLLDLDHTLERGEIMSVSSPLHPCIPTYNADGEPTGNWYYKVKAMFKGLIQ